MVGLFFLLLLSFRLSHGWITGRSHETSTILQMVQDRGLETRREGATPTEGGMTLYCKAASDGKSIGDCPFCHTVRMVLEEKGLEYELEPATSESKPGWLVEHYDGKMPALRHRRECYTESNVICEYLDFFFPEPPLQTSDNEAAQRAVDGFFPAMAKYIKHTPDGDDEDIALKEVLEDKLANLNAHLTGKEFLCGDTFSLDDCQIAPKLYHLQTSLGSFKSNAIDLKKDYPSIAKYMDTIFARDSFRKAIYPADAVVWGWGNARA